MTTFQPRYARYQEKVASSYNRQTLMQTLKAELAVCEPGRVELLMPYQAAMTQQHGFIHAGIITALMDSACGYAAFSLMSEEAGVLTVEFKTNLLAPAKGDQFRAVGKVVKSGRTLSFTQGECIALSDDGEKTVATINATIMAVYGRSDVDQ